MKAIWHTVRLFVLMALLAIRPALALPCGGDCDGGGDVTIDELVKGVGIALGSVAADLCHGMDTNNDGEVTIDEIVGAVSNALLGCPTQASPTPTRAAATATATASPSGPIDPTLLGTWSGSATNQSTQMSKQVRIKIELQGNNVVVTDLGGNLYRTAPASVTMSAPTRTTLVYTVVGNPTIVFNLTLGPNVLGGIYSATIIANPPQVEAFGLVLTKEGAASLPDPRLAGTWSGNGDKQPGGQIQVRLDFEIQGENVVVTDLNGNVFVHVTSPVTMHTEGGPTFLTYVCDSGPCTPPNPIVTLNLSLLASGRLVGAYTDNGISPSFNLRVGLNLGKES